jgi:hypothetical protein
VELWGNFFFDGRHAWIVTRVIEQGNCVHVVQVKWGDHVGRLSLSPIAPAAPLSVANKPPEKDGLPKPAGLKGGNPVAGIKPVAPASFGQLCLYLCP